MTGGQPHEGGLTVEMIASQVRAEGVERIAVVSDDPDKYDRAEISRRSNLLTTATTSTRSSASCAT